ncbi:MAG: UvrD-helicase domain-containing protein [Pelomonas sp.]|nr:UvrD-helicase domain-containing protein [Roseateles sp.]
MSKPKLTPEQQAVVDAPMQPLCVIACAGSGKTKTAVHRLVQMRRNMGASRGRLALLSFSNVAVDTFRKGYETLAADLPAGVGRDRVEIATLDSFITTNVLRSHGHRTMKSKHAAFVVTGNEAFLDGFTFNPGTFPMPVTKLNVGLVGGVEHFFYTQNDTAVVVPPQVGHALVKRLGQAGAYTHDLGRYWAYRTLKERPDLLKVIARRYPHVLIDEAQDIGSVHQAIVELLIGAGSSVTLIGDPNQGIYDFAGADGGFLRAYFVRPGVQPHELKKNFRSVPKIVKLANGLCGRDDEADRTAPDRPHGAFFTGYKRSEASQLLTAFQSAMVVSGSQIKQSAVLCRGRGLATEVRGDDVPAGQGAVKTMAAAAVSRDRKKDFQEAFRRVTVAVVALLDKPPHGLVSYVTQVGPAPAAFPRARELRRVIWSFTRDASAGLPSASLQADTQWHSTMVSRTKALLVRLQADFGLKTADNVGLKLKKTGLPAAPLMSAADLADEAARIRVDTVHKAKGESLDAVLYMTLKDHAEELLAGVGTEVGRIGYVAATRARDLLWVAVPKTALKELRPLLQAKGFEEVGVAQSSTSNPLATLLAKALD